MIVFIPFKAASTRVPNKNLKDFGGKQLWRHTVDKFIAAGHTVHVSTDAEIDTTAKVTVRPASLTLPSTSMNAVILHWLENTAAGVPDDTPIAQVHCTTPFLKPETVSRAAAFAEYGADCAVAVNEIRARLWRHEGRPGGGTYIPVNHNPMLLEDTQQLPPILAENSLFYIFTKGTFLETHNRLGRRPWLCPVVFPENVDIDTMVDWHLAKTLLEMEDD